MPRIQDTRYTQRYPWEKWLGKAKTVLLKGKDFDCDCRILQSMIRNNMQRRFFRERCKVEKGRVKTTIDYDRQTLTIHVDRSK
jgi:hypothetical protein